MTLSGAVWNHFETFVTVGIRVIIVTADLWTIRDCMTWTEDSRVMMICSHRDRRQQSLMQAPLQILIHLSTQPELLRYLGQLKHQDRSLRERVEMNIEIDRLLDRTLHEGIGSTVRTETILMPGGMSGLQVDVLRHMSKSIPVADMMNLSQAWPGHEAIGQVTEVLLRGLEMHLLSNPLHR